MWDIIFLFDCLFDGLKQKNGNLFSIKFIVIIWGVYFC